MSRPTVSQVQLELGVNLRKARTNRGWSLAGVQERSNGRWTGVAIGSYERGDRSITIPKLMELADFYGVTVASLIPKSGTPATQLAVAYEEAADYLRLSANRLRGMQ